MDTQKDALKVYAEIRRLQALKLAVTITGTVLSVFIFIVGATFAKAKHIDLFFLCMVLHIINMIIANRVLASLRKEKAKLRVQLREQEGDNNE